MEYGARSYAVMSMPDEVRVLLSARALIEAADSFRPIDAPAELKEHAESLCAKHGADGWLVETFEDHRKLKMIRRGEGIVVGEQLSNGEVVYQYLGVFDGKAWQVYAEQQAS